MTKGRILVVGELNQVGGIILTLLIGKDFDVNVVDSSRHFKNTYAEIYAQLSRTHYDMVLLTNNGLRPTDIQALIPEIKRKYPRIRIIVLSGWKTPEFIKDLKERGIDEFLPLPFDVDDLVRKVTSIFDQENRIKEGQIMEKLKEAFLIYINVVKTEFAKKRKKRVDKKSLRLIKNESLELNNLVMEIEDRNEFFILLSETKSVFKDREEFIFPIIAIVDQFIDIGGQVGSLNPYRWPMSGWPSNSDEAEEWNQKIEEISWKNAIHNILCRSGCYNSLYNNEIIDLDVLFLKYCKAFQGEQVKIRYFMPFGKVIFSEQCMKFKDFYIKRFSHEELEIILQNNINKVFYRHAYFNVEEVSDYWYICLEDTRPVQKLDDRDDIFKDPEEHIYHAYGLYPKKAEDILMKLILFDWEGALQRAWEASKASFEARLKFIEKVMNGEEECPEDLKDLKEAIKRTERHKKDIEQEDPTNTNLIKIIENSEINFEKSSEEIMDFPYKFDIPFVLKVYDNLLCRPPDRPMFAPWVSVSLSDAFGSISLIKDETELFKRFIPDVGEKISQIKTFCKEEFMNNAIGFLTKAFFSKGIEELLWHIVAIEALIGEKYRPDRSSTGLMADRLSKILANNDDERKKILKKFREIYSFRCEIIHGKRFKGETKSGYCFLARKWARESVVWFLNYLYEHYHKNPKGKMSRKDILRHIDNIRFN